MTIGVAYVRIEASNPFGATAVPKVQNASHPHALRADDQPASIKSEGEVYQKVEAKTGNQAKGNNQYSHH